MPCGFGLFLNLKTGKDELDPRIAEKDVCKTREMWGVGSLQKGAQSCLSPLLQMGHTHTL